MAKTVPTKIDNRPVICSECKARAANIRESLIHKRTCEMYRPNRKVDNTIEAIKHMKDGEHKTKTWRIKADQIIATMTPEELEDYEKFSKLWLDND